MFVKTFSSTFSITNRANYSRLFDSSLLIIALSFTLLTLAESKDSLGYFFNFSTKISFFVFKFFFHHFFKLTWNHKKLKKTNFIFYGLRNFIFNSFPYPYLLNLSLTTKAWDNPSILCVQLEIERKILLI